MEFLFFALLILVVLIPLVLGIIIPIYKNHREATGGISNYDSFMRKFVYKVCLSKEEIIERLKTRNTTDELACIFDANKPIITFSEYGSDRAYYFSVQEGEGYSVLRLGQVSSLAMQSHVPYKLNPYMIRKLQAQIVPFSEFGF